MLATHCTQQSSEWRCNSGGPMSRTRAQHIRSTLLGVDDGHIACPLVISAAIDFGKHDPLNTILKLLKKARIVDAEELRACYAVPEEPCICREWHDPAPLCFATASSDEVFAQVVLLGLCTAHVFDPRRPVLLTRASLTRRVQLFAGRGFYA